MKLNFCTLFDSNYLSRGAAMYESLLKHDRNFHLYVIAFDDKCFNVLQKLNWRHATIISLSDFEDEKLLAVKPTRTRAEYCWTCSSSSILYCIQTFKLPHCTYLDADLFFFSSPRILFEEIEKKSVCITSHHYSPRYNKALKAGKYCVQFVYFKNDENGMKCLKWWRDACLEWCYNRHEAGKFGDQKYLDEFATRFENVYELKHLGAGVAPWNIQQYHVFTKDEQLYAQEIKKNTAFAIIFYHFHYFRFLKNDDMDLGRYPLSKADVNLIYKPYLFALQEAKQKILTVDYSLNPHGQSKLTAWKRFTRFLVTHRCDANIYKISDLG